MNSDHLQIKEAFYLRATGKGYTRQAVGQHTLEGMIPMLMAEANFPGRYTLHSLRSTCATRLYLKGFDEQTVMEITGHKSTAVREYKRTSDELKAAASHALEAIEGRSCANEERNSKSVASVFLDSPIEVESDKNVINLSRKRGLKLVVRDTKFLKLEFI